MPLGTSGEDLRKRRITSLDALGAVRLFCGIAAALCKSASMPWQYQVELDFLYGKSDDDDDDELVAWFALQFLVMECIAAWSASQADIPKFGSRKWTSTCGLSVLINRVCG